MDYEVIVVGAGPAGIFTALTLVDLGVTSVLVLEKGREISRRQRRIPTDVLCGWGGAGAFSDGKLTLSSEVGGILGEFLNPEALNSLLEQADRIYVSNGASEKIFGAGHSDVDKLSEQARMAHLTLVPAPIRHIGTENCPVILDRLYQSLKDRIQVQTDCPVDHLLAEDGRVTGVILADGRVISSRFVVAAPGRVGAGWMKKEADRLGLKTISNPVDIGVRVELPAPVMKPISDVLYESKFIYYSKTFDEKVRTFCMNPYGEVVKEQHDDIVTVNGHSYAGRHTDNTNFAVLVSSAFTEPFDDPIAYGRSIARLANLLGGGVLVQRLGDLWAGRRTTKTRLDRCLTRPTLAEATPGDLSFVLPYRHLLSITEMLAALDRVAPGVNSRHTLLYGVEVKLYSNRIQVSPELETQISNLYAIGDGAGITRGLLQASASGIHAARSIVSRL